MRRSVWWGIAIRLGATFPAWAAGPTDSLVVALRSSQHDTSYVLTQTRYAWQLLQRSDFARADSVLRSAEQLSNRLNYPYGLEQTFYYVALGQYFRDRPGPALAALKRAQQLVNQHHFPPRDAQMVLSVLGVVYYELHQYDTSLRHYLAAVRLTEQHGLTFRVTPAYLGVGNVLKAMGKHDVAMDYYRKAVAASVREPEDRMRILAENHLGDGLSSLPKPNYRDALRHYERALTVAERAGGRGPLADVLTSVGRTHYNLKQYGRALPYLARSQRICEQDSLLDQLGANSLALGQTQQALKQYGPAEANLRRALALARQIDDAEAVLLRSTALAGFYAETGRYADAYTLQRNATALKDSLFSSESARHTQELTTQYETAKKEQQLRLMAEEKRSADLQRNALLVGAALLLALAVAVGAWLLNRARLRRLQDAQRLRKQIAHDLHDDIGSTLSSISLLSNMVNGLFDESKAGLNQDENVALPGTPDRRPDTAKRYVQKIAADARQILDAMDEIIWTINPGNDSLERVALRLQEYARPLMESRGIRFRFDLDPALANLPMPMEVRRNLFLIGKEAINNLVKYAEATEATVHFAREGKQVTVVVEDNGRGFDPAAPTLRTGQQSMKARAEAIGGALAVQSAPGQGTRLRVTV